MYLSSTARVVAIFFVLIAAVLLSLVVFNAASFEDVTENLTKLALVSLIVVAATGLIALIQKK